MPLTPAQKQKAYRDRKRAIKMAPIWAARRAQEELDRAKAEVARLEREAEETAAAVAEEEARRAEATRIAQGITDGSLHPSGRPWAANEVSRVDTSSPRAMQEAGRRAVLHAASDAFDRTGALAHDEFGPQPRRPDTLRGRDYGWWTGWDY